MTLRVTDTREEAEGIRCFELQDPGGADLPAFEAGAHLEVEVELPSGQPALRSYSLLGDPRDQRRYRIAVLLEPGGRGGSRFMHERIAAGTTLRVGAPANGFRLREAEHTILVAGGIGITPILSMVRVLAANGRSFELHYAATTPARMAFRETVESLAGPRAHLYFTGLGPHRPMDISALLSAATAATHVYVCGPRGLIRAVTAFGEQAGWPTSRIHVESFGATSRTSDAAIDVHLERSALTLHVAPDETILDAILRVGVWAPYECRRGECGTCMTRIIDGEPDHRDVCLSQEIRQHYMCTCVSRARSERLTLDL